MRARDYDFSGWVTKNDVRCSDGVTIRHNAFIDNDGQKVPLVWNHNHNSPEDVLGYMLLSNEDKGVYGYGYFNDTDRAKSAMELIRHGDIGYMSIAANRIKRSPQNDVVHGRIYEVSLVYTAANPGATIESVITHSENNQNGESALLFGLSDSLIHSADSLSSAEKNVDADKAEEELTDIFEEAVDALTDTQMADVIKYVAKLTGDDSEDMFDKLTDEQEEKVIDFVFKKVREGAKDTLEHEEQPAKNEKDVSDDDLSNKLEALTDEQFDDVIDYMRTLVKDKNIRVEDIADHLTEEDSKKVENYIMKLTSKSNDKGSGDIQHANSESEDDADGEEFEALLKSLTKDEIKDVIEYALSFVDPKELGDKNVFDVLTDEQFDKVVDYIEEIADKKKNIEHSDFTDGLSLVFGVISRTTEGV